MGIAALTESYDAAIKVRVGQPGTLVGYEIIEAPSALAAACGVGVEVYSLARMLASEGYNGPAIGRGAAFVAMAQVAVVVARRRDIDITTLLTGKSGRYGKQKRETAYWAGTSLDPRQWHLDVATYTLSEAAPDLALGSVHFHHPRSYSSRERFSEVARKWTNEGNAYIGPVPSTAPAYLQLMAPEPDAAVRERQLGAALAGYDDEAAAPGDPDAGHAHNYRGFLAGLVLLLAATKGGVA